ncbi:hypothetical protein DXG01_016503 [Tephrocybe rancida]|nr:hypothetical protein DXG01_016503 [Tephrocybe rancida]
MTDFTVVDPRGWEYDLHSVYSAYIGYFQLHNVPWYDRSWGHLFSSFESFLSFSWPTITVTDAWTGKPHIVTRLTSIGAFLKMIKTRFGETLPQAPNILQVSPFETATRHLRHVADYATYKKLHATLPAAVLSALKARVKAGEPKALRELWNKRDKTFVAIDFEWSERNERSCLEWGYAAIIAVVVAEWAYGAGKVTGRPIQRRTTEYVDKVVNKRFPTHPWQYAFGESQIAPKAKLAEIIQAIISSFASPDSETTANTLVLVAHGISGDLARLDEMKIKLPHNMLVIDTATFERVLHSSGQRGIMGERSPGSTLSLENLLRSFSTHPLPGAPAPAVLPTVMMHNAGNDAFMALFALQMLMDPEGTTAPVVKKGRIGRPGGGSPPTPLPRPRSVMLASPVMMGYQAVAQPSNGSYDLAGEFGNMRVGNEREKDEGQWQASKTRRPGRGNGASTGGRL